jgi:hypothetical protein
MIEIFKTNVDGIKNAEKILLMLQGRLPDCSITFDLEDCDRILRVEGSSLKSEMIEEMVVKAGFECSILE